VALRVCVTHTPALPTGLCTRCCHCLEQSFSWCHRLRGASFLTFHLHQVPTLPRRRDWSLMFIRQTGHFVEGSKAGTSWGLLCLSQALCVAVRGAFVSLWFAAGANDLERNKGEKGVQTGAGLMSPGTLCGTGNRDSGSQSVRVAGIAPLGEAFPVGVEQAVSSCPEKVHGWPGVSTEITWARMGVALHSRGRGLLTGAGALCMTLAESGCPNCGRGRRACLTPHPEPHPSLLHLGLPLGVAGSWLTVVTVEARVKRTGQVGHTVVRNFPLLLHPLVLLLLIILTC
uniref:Myeloma overexpressed n=1 Tax=Rhinopithecus bieti TaxID=61621 RepID=A0A2K6M1I3_RHIBE